MRTNISTLNGTTLTWQSSIHVGDQPIYGSERIGVYKNSAIIKSTYNYDNVSNYNPYYASQLSNYRQLCYRTLNLKRYELKDHLGNVRTNFSDILLAKNYVPNAGAPNVSTTFPYNGVEAHQTSLYNYYSFGMPKPNHGTSATNWLDEVGNVSSVGFNGQKRDDDVSGVGNHNIFKYREYDTRRGQFWSVDPLASSYPWNSTYAFAENDVIRCIDLEGLEKYDAKSFFVQQANGFAKLVNLDYKLIKQNTNFEVNMKMYYKGKTYQTNSFLSINGRDGRLSSPGHFKEIRTLSKPEVAQLMGYAEHILFDNLSTSLTREGVILKESVGGKLDFKNSAYKILNIDRNSLLEINGIVYNPNEAGNYLWGMALTRYQSFINADYLAEKGTSGRPDEWHEQKAIKQGMKEGEKNSNDDEFNQLSHDARIDYTENKENEE